MPLQYNQAFKWYYNENRIFAIEAILKNKKSSMYEKTNAFYYFEISLLIPETFKFL